MLIPKKSNVNTTPATSATEEAQEGGTINSISLGEQSGEEATDESATGEAAPEEATASDDADSANASN